MEVRGIQCDVCGATILTGVKLRGDKRAAIERGRIRPSYRIDFCDKCFESMMKFCKREALESEAK